MLVPENRPTVPATKKRRTGASPVRFDCGRLTPGDGPWLVPFVRIGLSSLFTIGCLGVAAGVLGAPEGVRERVSRWLDAAPVEDTPAEIGDARREAAAALAKGDQAATSAKPEERAAAEQFFETAQEWADLARELEELRALQERARAAETQLAELEAQLKREKAHLEETEARRGRAQATLNKLLTPSAPPLPGTSDTPARAPSEVTP